MNIDNVDAGKGGLEARIGAVTPDSPASASGMSTHPGNRVCVEINGEDDACSYESVLAALKRGAALKITLKVMLPRH